MTKREKTMREKENMVMQGFKIIIRTIPLSTGTAPHIFKAVSDVT